MDKGLNTKINRSSFLSPQLTKSVNDKSYYRNSLLNNKDVGYLLDRINTTIHEEEIPEKYYKISYRKILDKPVPKNIT